MSLIKQIETKLNDNQQAVRVYELMASDVVKILNRLGITIVCKNNHAYLQQTVNNQQLLTKIN